jgi:hypothetical protein
MITSKRMPLFPRPLREGVGGGVGVGVALRVAIAIIALATSASFAACTVTEAKRKFEGSERTIITLENDRIIVEIAPDLEGRVISYKDKSKATSAFECLDDCPYHYGCRWEGKPFTYRIDSKGPDRAAVTVIGGGKVSVGNIHNIVGVDMTTPLDLSIERTMSIDPTSTRLRIDVKVANTGESVAPLFRYMVHAVYGQVAHMPNDIGMYWFLPTKSDIEVFSRKRGSAEMWQANSTPPNHPFNRWSPAGKKADKPRYDAGGWGGMLTSAGPAYIMYDVKDFDFMQYWYGGDAEWHFTFEPQTKAIDLKPGESTAFGFTLAYDSKDVAFTTKTIAFERPNVPAEATPGGTLLIKARATTVQDKPEQAKIAIEIKDPQNQSLLAKTVEGTVTPFVFTDLAAEVALPADCKLGKYSWTAKYDDGRELASGQIEVMTPADVEKRKTERAVAGIKTELETKLKQQQTENELMRKTERYWREGANLALTLRDADTWHSAIPVSAASVSVRRGVTPVLGRWEKNEAVRIKSLKPVASILPENAEKLVAALNADVGVARSLAADVNGKGIVALLADRAKNRAEVVRIADNGSAKRFGRFSDKPSETDDTIGSGARAVAVDRDGNIWVATNAWGGTSVFKLNQDKSPYEESIIGEKGAVKKFSPDGKLLGTISLLETPTDLLLAEADGVPVLLAPYRNVSAYHGAMVREGVQVISINEARRIGEIKISAASVTLDEAGRLWGADVAGHIACFAISGKKLFDVATSPAPAILDAKLPPGSPVPADVRADGKGGAVVLYTLKRKLSILGSDGKETSEAKVIDAAAGALQRIFITPAGPLVLGEKGLAKP